MVLEQIFRIELIASKKRFAFLLGAMYAIVGLVFAMVLFPKQPTIIAIAFTSLTILPSLNRLLVLEENREARENKFNILQLLEEHSDIIIIYLFLFLGILFVFAMFTLIWPNAAYHEIFEEEVKLLIPSGSTYMSLLAGNVILLIIVVLASFIYGSGSIFILTWHAAIWGTVIGIILRNSAAIGGHNPLIYFSLAIFSIFFHFFAEAAGHFLGAVSGGVISAGVLREKLASRRFRLILEDSIIIFVIAVVLLAIGAYMQFYVTGSITQFL